MSWEEAIRQVVESMSEDWIRRRVAEGVERVRTRGAVWRSGMSLRQALDELWLSIVQELSGWSNTEQILVFSAIVREATDRAIAEWPVK